MVNLYGFKKFDLNLLAIFECIYQYSSISKVVATLYITPPTVSQLLQRLRTRFNDPLFIRSGKDIMPAVTGVDLHFHLEKSLNNLKQIINITRGFSLKSRFVIYGPQTTTNLSVTSLINSLREDSDIETEYHDILMSTETAENIPAYRKIDLVITTTPVRNRSIVCTHLKTIDCILACSDNHPRINKTGMLEQIQQEQLTYFFSEDRGIKDYRSRTSEPTALHKAGFSSDSLLSIANIIASMDTVGFLPKQIYEFYQPALEFKEIKTNSKLPEIKLFIMCNRTSLNHKAFVECMNKLSLDN